MQRLGRFAQTLVFALMLVAACGWVLWLSAPAARTYSDRAWIRDGDRCRYALVSEAGTAPCQDLAP